MAAKPNFRICPQCSTRNRLDKEFCVKCGEPLEGIKAGDPNAPEKTKGKPGFFVAGGDEGQNPLVPLVLVILTLLVAVAGWRYVASTPAPTPLPTTEARPVTQASLPEAKLVAGAPGVEDYSAGVAALRAGDFQTAIRLLRAAVAAANRADYRLALADALEKSGATTDALAEFTNAAGLEPGNVRYATELARALNRAGRNPEAIRAYAAALVVEADNVALLREITNLLLGGGDLAGARPYLVRIVQLQPDDLSPKQDLARALEAASDFAGAAVQYQAILALRPEAHMSRALLSEVYMKQNRSSDALRTLDEGLALAPSAALLYREKGRVLDRLNRGAEAITAYREYLRLAPGATDARVFTERITQLTPAGEE